LTLALAETGAEIIAVEVDHGLVPVLKSVVAEQLSVTVIDGDAMTLDWEALIPAGRTAIVVANLPYNIATPLIADLLDQVPRIERFVVMVQKEVAQRLAATAGTSDYGAISVKVSYWATAQLLGDVPASVFIPRPKVTSSIIEIIRRSEPAIDEEVRAKDLFTVVRKAFGQRRKMLRRSLSDITTAEVFTRAQISPEARPEELDVYQWGRLVREILIARRSVELGTSDD
jgi:16S rRNA (adenine1518-N6/adenine1519-N6)-dimethyltransferase